MDVAGWSSHGEGDSLTRLQSEGLGSRTTVWEEAPQGVNAGDSCPPGPSWPPKLLLSSEEEEVREKKRTCLFLGIRWLGSSQWPLSVPHLL